jgi:ERG8-type phosphomevalonate kinase
MKSEIHAMAPGKILWLGGYAVLEKPNIGFTTAVDSHINVIVKQRDDSLVRLYVPQFDMVATGRIDKSTGRIDMAVPAELSYVKTAIELASRYAVQTGVKPTGLTISCTNHHGMGYQIEDTADGRKIIKTGLGSSAAVTVATTGALLNLFGIDGEDHEVLHKMAQVAHNLAAGKIGSGFDIATSTYGPIVYTRFSPEIISNLHSDFTNDELYGLINSKWDYTIKKADIPSSFGSVFATFVDDSASTVPMVKKVLALKTTEPEFFRDTMKGINDANIKALETMTALSKEGASDSLTREFVELFDRSRLLTKELGVHAGTPIEDDEVTELVGHSKRNGALVAKSPGAGGRDSMVALTNSEEDRKRLAGFWSAKANLKLIDVNLSQEGFTFKM